MIRKGGGILAGNISHIMQSIENLPSAVTATAIQINGSPSPWTGSVGECGCNCPQAVAIEHQSNELHDESQDSLLGRQEEIFEVIILTQLQVFWSSIGTDSRYIARNISYVSFT